MEQYLLQLPKRLAQEVRKGIAGGEASNVEMISGGTTPKSICTRTNP